jgi:hypothetical protein
LGLPLVGLLASLLWYCEPGQSLDPTPDPGEQPGLIPEISITAPGALLPSDTGSVLVTVTDSTGQPVSDLPLTVVSNKFILLATGTNSAFSLTTVPVGGAFGFRVFSNIPGAGDVSISVGSGSDRRTQTVRIIVSEKPVAPLVQDETPKMLTTRDSSVVVITVVDSAEGRPLPNVEVMASSSFFELFNVGDEGVFSLDTTGSNGQIAFRIHSDEVGPGTIQLRVTTAARIVRIVTLSAQVTDEVTTERPRNMVFTALRPTLKADGSDSTSLKVLVKDDNNNPLAGETIRFTSTGGLVQAEATTDQWGIALATLISERANKTVIVTATLVKDGKTSQQSVRFEGLQVNILASKKVIMRDSIVDVIFQLLDANARPMSGDSLEIKVSGAYQGIGGTGIDSMVRIVDTKGEFRTTVTSRDARTVNIEASALGARSTAKVIFTNNSLTLSSNRSSIIGDGAATASITAKLTDGSNANINGAELRFTTTFGNIVESPFVSTSGGAGTRTLRAPQGAGIAIINVEAYSSSGDLIASGSIQIRVTPLKVQRVNLRVTPDNIPVKIGEAQLIAEAYDSTDNLMNDVLIGFKMIKGAGGGDELIDPPVAYTQSGIASSNFKAGAVISFYQSVKVTALALDINGGDTIVLASSDTIGLTVSGPPAKVSIGANILKGLNPNDGTFGLPAAAVVTDVNGNLVADGTMVSFSLHPIAGFYVWPRHRLINISPFFDFSDSITVKLPWTDYNNNLKLDPNELPSDSNKTNPARGEDIDGNGVINFPPESYRDINKDGLWTASNVEPNFVRPWPDTGIGFVDYNGDGIQQFQEPFDDINEDGICQCTGQWDSNGNLYEESYFGSVANRPYPGYASVGIDKQVATSAGKAPTTIVYVQTDANRLRVRVTAEANGIRSNVDITLPIILSEE